MYRFATVVLVTYVVILYGHYVGELFDLTEDNIYEYSYKRGITVALRVIITVIVSTLVWPYKARKDLRKVLSKIFLQFADLYSGVLSIFLAHSGTSEELQVHNITCSKLELALQVNIVRAEALLQSVVHEPRYLFHSAYLMIYTLW
jgi:hypothetical protein